MMPFSCLASNEIFAYFHSSTTSSTNSSAALDAGGLANPAADNMALMHKSEEMRLREHICQLKTIRSTIQGNTYTYVIFIGEHGRSFFKSTAVGLFLIFHVKYKGTKIPRMFPSHLSIFD